MRRKGSVAEIRSDSNVRPTFPFWYVALGRETIRFWKLGCGVVLVETLGRET